MKKRLSLTLALCALMLSACGFTPIYGTKGEGGAYVQKALNNIVIANIPNENGQFLRNKLIDRLYFKGRPLKPEAKLYVNLSYIEADSGIQKDATSTRSRLHMSASFYLISVESRKRIFTSHASTIASYGKLDAQYGTLATQRDAYKRALIEVSEQIINRLSLFYAEKAPFDQKTQKVSHKR